MDKLRRILRADDGLGLTEVLVSIFLLGIVALSLLPLLIMGMKLAVSNTTLAAATQLANDRVKLAQTGSPLCTGPDSVYHVITGVQDGTVATGTFLTTDKRGVELRAETTVEGACPAGAAAATLKVTSVVTRTDTGQELASASTLVLVTG